MEQPLRGADDLGGIRIVGEGMAHRIGDRLAGGGIVAIAGVWAVAWIGATMKLCATLQPVEDFAEH